MGNGFRIKLSLAVFTAFMLCGCGANEGILRSGRPDPNAANSAPVLSSTDRILGDMETAGFTTVFVLRRKDGGKISSEDRGVMRVQTSDANRRIGSDDETAFVIGSNHPMKPEQMAVLNDRFSVEDHSPTAEAGSNVSNR